MKTITYDETKWQLVPKCPTDEMYFAGKKAIETSMMQSKAAEAYVAMLEAAPTETKVERKEVQYSSIRHELLCDYTRSLKTKLHDERLKVEKLRELLKSANHTYLGDDFVACLKPETIEKLLSETAGE